MKALVFCLLAALVAHHAIKDTRPPRTPAQAKAWADWYDLHPNGGGV